MRKILGILLLVVACFALGPSASARTPPVDVVVQPSFADRATDWRSGYSLILLREGEDLVSARVRLEEKGFRPALVIPPRTLLGWASQGAELMDVPGVYKVFTTPADASALPRGDPATGSAVRFFNSVAGGTLRWNESIPPDLPPLVGDAQDHPPMDTQAYRDNLAAQGIREDASVPTAAISADAKYMLGTIVVNVFFVESNGTIDPNLYTWTGEDVQATIDGIGAALSWWSGQAALRGESVSFYLNYYLPSDARCATGYEPILHSSSAASLWVDQILANFGYSSGTFLDKVAAFNTWSRYHFGTNDAFSAFVEYNPDPAPSKFTDGKSAWAYLGGPLLHILFRSYGWPVDRVFAHETGHIFWASDENCPCTCDPWHNGVNNGNCSVCNSGSAECIMRWCEWALCDYTPGHVGWNLPKGCFYLDVYQDPERGWASGLPSPNCTWNYYVAGTEVSLIAAPACGYQFDHWEGDITGSTNPMTLVLSTNMSIWPKFAALPPCWDPSEPNNSPATATPLPWGQATAYVEICPADDVDYFVFSTDSAEAILVWAFGSPHLSLLDSNGRTLASADLNSFPLGFRLGERGTYYLRVEAGSDYDPLDCTRRFYSLHLERITSPEISSRSTSQTPNIDGVLSPGEWIGAATYDVRVREDLPHAVTLYIMNDARHLFIAVDDPNVVTNDEHVSTLVWFDDNPLPSDGQWTNATCGNSDGEGVFYVDGNTVAFGEFVDVDQVCPSVEPAPGVSGALGFLSGHSQTEIAIDLASSALRVGPGERFGFSIETRGDSMSGITGFWPAYIVPEIPVYYGWLRLPERPPLEVSHIEITQAIQDESNGVVLIEGKPTFVRVYVSCGPDGRVPADAPIALRVFNSSGEPLGVRVPFGGYLYTSCWESMESQRGDLRKTINFDLPPEWTTGTITLRAEVDGTSLTEPARFVPAKALRVAMVPIQYNPPLWSLCTPVGGAAPSDRIKTAASWALQAFPTARIEIEWLPTMPFTEPLCWPWNNDDKLFNALMNWSANATAPYVYGWLPDGAKGGGLARVLVDGDGCNLGGRVAFGDDSSDGPRLLAHEVGHLLGRPEIDKLRCGIPTGRCTDWPYGDDRHINDYGVEISQGEFVLKKSQDTYDYMTYCGSMPAKNVWTSAWTYQHLYSETLKVEAADMAAEASADLGPYFVVSGLVYTNSIAILEPIWVITPTVTPEVPPVGTQYCLEAQDSAGAALAGHCFDLAFMNYESGEATDVDGFNIMLPYLSGVARIVLKQGTLELASQPVTANKPVVNVLSPNGGDTWSATGTYTITWNASDADNDPLTYGVLYSLDGSNWVPVGMAITTTQLVVNASELAGGSAARVRVLATDGVNTTADESDAGFTVGRKGPQAYVLSPEQDVTIAPGTPLWLNGFAYDLEDSTLGESALHWSSDRDGDLGSGSWVLADLSPGHHVITLTATDSDGNTATATVNVFVYVTQLAPGWNMVSIPFSLPSTVITDVLAPIAGQYDLVYAYDASNSAAPWKHYNPSAPPWASNLSTISPGMGLWIRATDAATLTITSTVPVSTEILLSAGWNLVGYPQLQTRPITEALQSIEGKYAQVYAYDAAHPENPWQIFDVGAPPGAWTLTEMKPGRGYWIRVTQPCTLTITSP